MPHPSVFVDCGHIIRYLNQSARHRYYQMHGYNNLIGKSLLDCHPGASKEKIRGVSVNNQRIRINPVLDKDGIWLGTLNALS